RHQPWAAGRVGAGLRRPLADRGCRLLAAQAGSPLDLAWLRHLRCRRQRVLTPAGADQLDIAIAADLGPALAADGKTHVALGHQPHVAVAAGRRLRRELLAIGLLRSARWFRGEIHKAWID